MKKNTKKICVVLLLAIVAIASYFVSGTYAKYTRAVSGSDTVTVAKFSVDASGLNKEQNATIDLFDTVKEADLSANEENVLAGKIAPGTGGEFTTTLTNKSEVDVKAVITLKETSNTSNVPVEKFPMKSRIENVSKEVDFVIARYPSYALNVKTEKIEDRIVNTAEESKTISLNLKYKAVNTIETPSVYVVVKKKSNDTNYNTIINNWTYTLADQIKDTTNSTDKIESTTMTLNIPQGSENGFYRVFITIGDKTTSLNIVIYDGEMSEVIVGQNDT